MFNILIITMLLSVIYNFLTGNNKITNLNCGIFAFVGTSSDKFSPVLFNILGVYNDSRGGDSCGVYFNRNAILGIKTDSKYESLVKSQKLHTTIKLGKYPIAIGHCRKASVGAVSEKNIQPVLVRNASKDNKLVYVHSHNGTITNHKDLAKKYQVEIQDDESDSVIMSKLIEKEGFDILGEYEGSAALVMHFTKEPNVLYAFHGQSKQYNYLAEERPLHYLTMPGIGTYISSEAPPLEFIGNGTKATSFKYNIVYKLIGDEVIEFKKIEREKAILKKFTTVVNSSNYQHGDSEYWRRYYEDKNKSTSNNIVHSSYRKTLSNNICNADVETKLVYTLASTRINFHRGFYMIGANKANGEVICDAFGFVRNKTYKTIADLYYLYFFHGILMVNKDAYEEILSIAESWGIITSELLNTTNNWNLIGDLIAENSLFPFTKHVVGFSNCGYMTPSVYFPNDKNCKDVYYTGEYTPLFSDNKYEFDNGDLEEVTPLKSVYILSDFLEEYGWFSEYMDFGTNGENKQIPPVQTTTAPKEDKKKLENLCLKCGDISCEFKGSDDTPFDPGDICDNFIDGDDKESVLPTLIHTIVSEITPIVADLTQVIGEVESSGYKDLVSTQFSLMTEANNKLKEISK